MMKSQDWNYLIDIYPPSHKLVIVLNTRYTKVSTDIWEHDKWASGKTWTHWAYLNMPF